MDGDQATFGSELASVITDAIAAGRAGNSVRSVALLKRAYALSLDRHDASSAAIALSHLSQQARLANDLPASLNYARSIFNLKGSHAGPIAFKAYLAVAHHYASIGLDAKVAELMLEAESSLSDANLSDVCEYFELRGTAEARIGNGAASVRAFDTLLDLSERHDPPAARIERLSSAAFNAAGQGLMGRAFYLNERAVAIAKVDPSDYGRSIATLSYAYNALLAGDLRRSKSLIEAAELWPNPHLYVRLLRTAAGLLLGCLIDDRDLMTRCLDLSVLELALNEASAYRAGPAAAAVHEYYINVGDVRSAARLRARVMSRITKPHGCWSILLQIALFGDDEDTERAAAVLAPYENFPLARAHGVAVESRLASLQGNKRLKAARASSAADMFGDLSWRYHQAVCLQLAGRKVQAQKVFRAMGARHHFETVPHPNRRPAHRLNRDLSGADRQIAMLVAQGLTNGQIARRLGMPERTVKYRLTAIFDRLGVQRRSGLAELLHRDASVLNAICKST